MNIRSLALTILAALCPSISVAQQYRPDWNARNFYEELHWCRSSIVFPSASDYERKAISSGRSTEEARNETIAITPASEVVASASCYCAMNELAKDITYTSFAADKAKVSGYIQGTKCKEATAQAIRSFSRERANELRLR